MRENFIENVQCNYICCPVKIKLYLQQYMLQYSPNQRGVNLNLGTPAFLKRIESSMSIFVPLNAMALSPFN